jgi:hypothetical protein
MCNVQDGSCNTLAEPNSTIHLQASAESIIHTWYLPAWRSPVAFTVHPEPTVALPLLANVEMKDYPYFFSQALYSMQSILFTVSTKAFSSPWRAVRSQDQYIINTLSSCAWCRAQAHKIQGNNIHDSAPLFRVKGANWLLNFAINNAWTFFSQIHALANHKTGLEVFSKSIANHNLQAQQLSSHLVITIIPAAI